MKAFFNAILGCPVAFLFLVSAATPVKSAEAPPSWLGVGHAGAVNAAAVSPDGTLLATAGDDATIKFWRLPQATFAGTVFYGASQVRRLAFSPDSASLAAGYYDGAVCVWSATNFSLSRKLTVSWASHSITYTTNAGQILSLAWNRDGTRLVSGGGDWFTRLWRLSDGQQAASVVKPKGMVMATAFSPDGNYVALGGEDGSLTIVKGTDLSGVKTNTHGGVVTCVAFSPSGTLLVSAGLDQVVKIWRTNDWGLSASRSIGKPVTALSFDSAGARIFVGDSAGTLRALQAPDWAPGGSWAAHGGGVLGIAMWPGAQRVLTTGGDGTVAAWDASSGARAWQAGGHAGMVGKVLQSPDGSLVAAAGPKGLIKVWKAASGEPAYSLEAHTNQVSALIFSPDSRLLVSGGGCLDNRIRVWESATGKALAVCLAHTNGVNALAFSPEGVIASAGDRSEEVIRFWDAQCQPLGMIDSQPLGAIALAYSLDGRKLASGAQFGTGQVIVRHYKYGTNSVLNAHAGGVQNLAFHPAGELLVTAGRSDKLVRVWRIADSALLASWAVAQGAASVCFSPDGKLVAAGGVDGISFRNTADWQPAWSRTNETYRVSSIAFSPGGSFFVFGREDGSLGSLPNPVATPAAPSLAMQFAPDNRTLRIQNPGYTPYLTIEVSADLGHWLPLTNAIGGGAQFEVLDSQAAGPVRFYRVSAPQ